MRKRKSAVPNFAEPKPFNKRSKLKDFESPVQDRRPPGVKGTKRNRCDEEGEAYDRGRDSGSDGDSEGDLCDAPIDYFSDGCSEIGEAAGAGERDEEGEAEGDFDMKFRMDDRPGLSGVRRNDRVPHTARQKDDDSRQERNADDRRQGSTREMARGGGGGGGGGAGGGIGGGRSLSVGGVSVASDLDQRESGIRSKIHDVLDSADKKPRPLTSPYNDFKFSRQHPQAQARTQRGGLKTAGERNAGVFRGGGSTGAVSEKERLLRVVDSDHAALAGQRFVIFTSTPCSLRLPLPFLVDKLTDCQYIDRQITNGHCHFLSYL
jgi:hypothetical protein